MFLFRLFQTSGLPPRRRCFGMGLIVWILACMKCFKETMMRVRFPSATCIYGLFLIFAIATSAESAEEPTDYSIEENILYRGETSDGLTDYIKERCRLDLYYPKQTSNFPTVVYFHGGGLTTGEKYIPEKLKNQKIAIATVNYRLSPKVECSVCIDDAAASIAWIFKNIARYGGNPALVFVSGHSAGGYLTSMVGLDKSYLAKYGIDANRIAGLIPFSGHTITHFTIRAGRGIPGTQPVIDELAPLYHVRKDAPPLVLITGDREIEMLGRYEENAYLMRMMKVVGHPHTMLYECPGFNHGTMVDPACSLLLKYIRQEGVHLDPENYLAWLHSILNEKEFLAAAFNLSDLWLDKFQGEFPVSKIDPPLEGKDPGNRGAQELVIYTPAYEKSSTGTNSWGKEAIVVNGVVQKLTGADTRIPADGYVLSGNGEAANWISKLIPGTALEYDSTRIRIRFTSPGETKIPAQGRLLSLKGRFFMTFQVAETSKMSAASKDSAGWLLGNIQSLQAADMPPSAAALEALSKALDHWEEQFKRRE